MATRGLRQSGLSLCALLAAACGGSTGNDDAASSSGGSGATAGSGGASGVAPHCESPPPATIDFEQTCPSFIPALVPSEVVFVDRAVTGGMQAYRFRASADCGFDVVISLPGLDFAADSEPYEMSNWWIGGAAPTGLLAVVLRRAGNDAPLLGVATETNSELLSELLWDLAITLGGPACDDSGTLVQTIMTRDGTALVCEDEVPGIRFCEDELGSYRLVDYVGPPESTDGPAVVGDAQLLTLSP